MKPIKIQLATETASLSEKQKRDGQKEIVNMAKSFRTEVVASRVLTTALLAAGLTRNDVHVAALVRNDRHRFVPVVVLPASYADRATTLAAHNVYVMTDAKAFNAANKPSGAVN